MPANRVPLTLAVLFERAVEKHGGQQAVAKRCGINQSTVSAILAGKIRSVKTKNLLKYAGCLGVKPSTVIRACSIAPKIRAPGRLSVQTDECGSAPDSTVKGPQS